MTNPQVQLDSVLEAPNLYINGLVVSNNSTTPNTKVNISSGLCRDSNNIVDISVGINNPDNMGATVVAPLVVDSAVVGAVNGLDAGTLAANTMYAVYVIADSRGYQQTGGLLSLASNALPTMPFGYDSFRIVGFIRTDGSSHFVLGFSFGAGSYRKWVYNGAQTVLSGGTSATYANVNVSAAVPPQQNAVAWVESDFNANAANDLLRMRNFSATGDQINVRAPVAGATAKTQTLSPVIVGLNSGAATIAYTVSAGSVDLLVMAYDFAV